MWKKQFAPILIASIMATNVSATLAAELDAPAVSAPTPSADPCSSPVCAASEALGANLPGSAIPVPAPAPAAVPLKRIPVEFRLDSLTVEGQVYPDERLRIVEPSERRLDIGLMVLGALVGAFRTPVPKALYRGRKVETLLHPDGDEFKASLQLAIDQWFASHPERQSQTLKNPFFIRQDLFSLVYENDGDEKTPYELTIKSTIHRKPDSAWWLGAPQQVVCFHTYQAPTLSREQWFENDYAEVKVRAAEHRAACVQQVALALDGLLKP